MQLAVLMLGCNLFHNLLQLITPIVELWHKVRVSSAVASGRQRSTISRRREASSRDVSSRQCKAHRLCVHARARLLFSYLGVARLMAGGAKSVWPACCTSGFVIASRSSGRRAGPAGRLTSGCEHLLCVCKRHIAYQQPLVVYLCVVAVFLVLRVVMAIVVVTSQPSRLMLQCHLATIIHTHLAVVVVVLLQT